MEKPDQLEHNSLPTCRCKHDKNHPMVRANAEYTIMGHLLIMFGITYKPIKITYECLKCRECFDETTDKDDLKNYNY